MTEENTIGMRRSPSYRVASSRPILTALGSKHLLGAAPKPPKQLDCRKSVKNHIWAKKECTLYYPSGQIAVALVVDTFCEQSEWPRTPLPPGGGPSNPTGKKREQFAHERRTFLFWAAVGGGSSHCTDDTSTMEARVNMALFPTWSRAFVFPFSPAPSQLGWRSLAPSLHPSPTSSRPARRLHATDASSSSRIGRPWNGHRRR